MKLFLCEVRLVLPEVEVDLHELDESMNLVVNHHSHLRSLPVSVVVSVVAAGCVAAASVAAASGGSIVLFCREDARGGSI